jgi:putative ABC transport system permease protein
MGGESFNARPGEMSIVQDRIPEVETASRVKKTNYFGKQISIDGQYIASKYNSVTEVDPSFFGFFPSTFVEGSEECLHDRNQLILEESFARLYFPDKNPMGKTVIIRTDTCIVGGIVRFPERSLLKEQYIIKGFKQPDEPTASTFFIPNDLVLLRFLEGTDIEATRALIDTLIRKEFPNYSKSQVTFPIKDIYFSPNNNTDILNKGNRSMIYVLIAAGILLLVSALFNYINLSVALSNKRAKEMAIRSTLGESRGRIFGRYILESVVFMAVCLAFAIALAKWLEPLFNRYVASDIGLDIAFSEPYLITYILMAIVVGAVSGIIPAFMVHRNDPVSIIKGNQRRQTKTVF